MHAKRQQHSCQAGSPPFVKAGSSRKACQSTSNRAGACSFKSCMAVFSRFQPTQHLREGQGGH